NVVEFKQRGGHVQIQPNPTTGQVGCFIERRETLRVSVEGLGWEKAGVPVDPEPADAGPPQATALAGVHEVELRAAQGSDCSAALAALGGAYLALPCLVEYALEGTPAVEDAASPD